MSSSAQISEISILVESLKFSLSDIIDTEHETFQALDQLVSLCNALDTYSSDNLFANIKANGILSFFKVVKKFLQLAQSEARSKSKCEDFLIICRLLNNLTEKTIKCAAILRSATAVECSKKGYLFDDPLIHDVESDIAKFTLELMKDSYFHPIFREGFRVLHWNYPMFWLDNMTNLFKLTRPVAFATNLGGIFTLLTRFFDKRHLEQRFLDYVTYEWPQLPNCLLQAFTFQPMKALLRVLMWNTVCVQTIFVTSQNRYVLDCDNLHIEDCLRRNVKAIRCRILRKNPSASCTKLVFYCFGGGYITGSVEFAEFSYLNEWCKALSDDCCILSVDYSLLVPYPKPLQDLLDVYIWLTTSKDDVQTTLGFVPSKIILCGESCGAHLNLSLLLVLHDIRSKYQNSIKEPDGFLSLCGLLDLTAIYIPSGVMSVLDPWQNLSLISMIHAVPAGWIPHETKLTSNATWRLILRILGFSLVKPWALESKENYDYMYKFIRRKLLSRYTSPIFARELFELNTPLRLVCPEFCPLLDQSISLASKWKGPVKVQILDGLSHFSLHLGLQGESVKKGRQLCLQHLNELLND